MLVFRRIHIIEIDYVKIFNIVTEYGPPLLLVDDSKSKYIF